MKRAGTMLSYGAVRSCMKACAAVTLAGFPVAPGWQSVARAADAPPAVYSFQKQIQDALRASIGKGADPALAPIGKTDTYMVTEVYRVKEAPPAAHPGWTELHIILDGRAVLVTGGRIAGGVGKAGNFIEGGVRQTVHKGDVVIVPANTPHWYTQIDEPITAIEVRFQDPAVATGTAAAK